MYLGKFGSEQANDEVKESIRFHIMKFRDWKVTLKKKKRRKEMKKKNEPCEFFSSFKHMLRVR